uniref:Uncharacterized protein n=1 Tax=Oncorhynchus mykiss TaxID=8022 RepID=A0A8C7S6W4_ONCMY
ITNPLRVTFTDSTPFPSSLKPQMDPKAGTAHMKSSNDMENHVYVKAKSCVSEHFKLHTHLVISHISSWIIRLLFNIVYE